MRLQVHFGPGSVLVDTDDVDTIVHHAVGLARLVLPRGFCKFLLPRGSDIAPLGVACGSARCPAFARCVLENPPQGAGESKTTTTTMNGEEVRLELMLEVQTRTHGPLLVINRRQWSWTRDVLKRELLQQSPSPSGATAVDTINNNDSDSGGGGGETGGNSVEAVLPLEVIFLYRGAESGVLRVCRYETFVDQPPPHDVHQAVEMVSVVDDCGNKMGELHFDCTRPPPLNRLKRSLQTLLSRSCSMNASYRIGENTELISIQGDQEIINLVRSLQHFGTRNILLVVSLPSSASLPSVPARDGTPYMHRASASHSPLPPSTSSTTRAPRPTPFASNDSTAVDSKREGTRNMVGSYAQIMRGLRQGVADETDEKIHQAASPPSSEIPSPPVLHAVEEQEEEPNEKTPAPAAAEKEAATNVLPSVTNHDDVSIPANSMHAATDASGRKGNELLLVHYELDPVVVHITGRITEMELCSLADAIVAWCMQSKKRSENNNSDPGDAATEGKKFQRVSDSTYTLQLNECGVLDDAQVEKLKACLVDVVKGFGCRQLCETTKEGLVECLSRYSEQKNR